MSIEKRWISSLKELLGEAWAKDRPEVCEANRIDGRLPGVVVYPETPDETARVVALAAGEGKMIVPKGGGTKIALGNTPQEVDIVLSTSRMRRVVDYDIANLSVSLEAGLTLGEVQEQLSGEGRGYCIPLDPPYTGRATLGGIVATNASGPKRFLYGTARDVILGLKWVSPTGKITAAGGKTVKNVAGYDLTKLLIGSFGTLGVITEITFKILPLPEGAKTIVAVFAGLAEADKMARRLLHSALYPAAIELFNPSAAGLLRAGETPGYLLAVGIEGMAEDVERQAGEVTRLGEELGALKVETTGGAEHKKLMTAIRDLPAELFDRYPEALAVKANFPLAGYAGVHRCFEGLAKEAGVDCVLAGHAGSGILSGYLLAEEGREGTLINLVSALRAEMGKREGNLIIERASVRIKEGIDVWGIPRDDRLVMNMIKGEMDPAGIMNRGRFVAGI